MNYFEQKMYQLPHIGYVLQQGQENGMVKDLQGIPKYPFMGMDQGILGHGRFQGNMEIPGEKCVG